MRIDTRTPDAAALTELGRRIRAVRLARNISQEQLADESGIGRVTLQRIERGSTGSSLRSLIRILRVLGLSEGLDQLLPEPRPSPLRQLEAEGKGRQRAGSKRSGGADPGASRGWAWGDEEGESR
jgi:transcriptional regulator with XRE-family HTH domain